MPVISLDLCLSGGDVTDPIVRPGGLWVSAVHTSHVLDVKRSILKMWNVVTGASVELLADPSPVAGRGLSGGVHQWSPDGSRVCVVLSGGGILVCELSHDEVTTHNTVVDGGAWTTPMFSCDGTSVLAVRDWNHIARFTRDQRNPTHWNHQTFSHDADFAWDVAEWNGQPIFHAWNRPHMPWTVSRITSDHDNALVSKANVAVQQARTSRDGKSFGYISDKNGVLNLTVFRDGKEIVIEDVCEHAGPSWGSGNRTWCFNTDASIVAYTRNEDGYGSLWVHSLQEGVSKRVGKAVHGCVSWEGDTLAALRSGAKTPPELVRYDMSTVQLLMRDEVPIEKHMIFFAGDERWYERQVREHCVEPTVVKVPSESSEGTELTVRVYQPIAPNGVLLSWVHGGPNDQWQVSFMPRHLYWLSRGYTIAVIDPRGSTGYGRGFQQSLEGTWGEGDAFDVIRATRYIQEIATMQPAHTVLIGASAGALAVLGAVVHSADDPIAAGVVVSYPVVDLLALANADDPFEAHYVSTLVGASDGNDPLWVERSPHNHPEAFHKIPILAFHGDSDQIVPQSHSRMLCDAVTSVGGEATLHILAGEGHGFRQRLNQEFEYLTTEEFLTRFMP